MNLVLDVISLNMKFEYKMPVDVRDREWVRGLTLVPNSGKTVGEN